MGGDGKWVSATSSTASAEGYYCYYPIPSQGPSAQMAGSVALSPRGCTTKICVYTDQQLCTLDPRCAYQSGKCSVSPCSAKDSVETCSTIPGCYFDATLEVCKPNPADVCASRSSTNCDDGSGTCVSASGGCLMAPCTQYTDIKSCNNDPACMMADGQCVRTLCGSTTKELCLTDSNCAWTATAGCAPNACLQSTTAAQCGQYSDCEYVATASPPCAPSVCTAPDELLCVSDARCVYDKTKSQCTRSGCTLQTFGTCSATTGCAWDSTNQRCVRSQCNYNDQVTCLAASTKDALTGADVSICEWIYTGGVAGCSPLNIDEMTKILAAAADSSNSDDCTPKEKDLTVLAAVLGFLAFLLACVLAAMWHRQRFMAKALKFEMYGEAVEEDEASQMTSDYQQLDKAAVPMPLAREETPETEAHRTSL
eukprot:GDKK01041856.1.p1 GENE.GDKK01041856.1~~GDKK01041856.1.p1  ORF type:complete len:436 (-),score=10.65 GDKK01041856.1:615-1886(-)